MYSTITARVIDQTLTITNVPKIASGGENEIRVEVTFDNYWSGLGRTAIFYRKENQVYHVVMVNDVCVIPREVLTEAGTLYFGIIGTDGSSVRTTEVVALSVSQGAITGLGNFQPLPDVYKQLMSAYAQAINDIAVESARIDNLLSAETTDGELIDIRVGADGTTYASAGEAVREQFYSVPNYVRVCFEKEKSLHFNTAERTVTSTATLFLYRGADKVAVPAFTAEYDDSANQWCVVYDKSDSTVKCLMAGDAVLKRRDVWVMYYFVHNYLPYAVTPAINTGYYVNGSLYLGADSDTFCLWSMGGNGQISFDTAENTMTLSGAILCTYKDRKISVAPGVYPYDVGDTRPVFVYDLADNKGKFVIYSDQSSDHIRLFTVQANALENPWYQTFNYDYYVNDVLYTRNTLAGSVVGGEVVVYVNADTGDDANVGDATNPLKSIQTAVSRGATVVYAAPGVYKERLSVSDRASFKLFATFPDYVVGETGGNKVVIDGSVDLKPVNDTDTGLKVASYSCEEGGYMHRVFIAKTLDAIETAARSDGHNVALWDVTSCVSGHTRLTPVLTLAECAATANSWFYDGVTVYVNGTGSNYKLIDGEINSSVIERVGHFEIEDVAFLFVRGAALQMSHVNSGVLRNCEFGYSGLGDGADCDYANVDFYDCIAHHNRNDGFNFHNHGHSSVVNCVGCYNFDDGISHHDACTGEIRGGQWHHNAKAGIASPTYGAVVDVYNAVSHDNMYGVMVASDDEHGVPDRDIIVSGCALYSNSIGLSVSEYSALSVGNVFANNETETKQGASGAIMTM